MTERTPLQELMATARQMAADIAAEPLALSAMAKAQAGAQAGAELAATATRRIVGRDQEIAGVIDEVTRAIDEVVEVVLVQQDLIEGLMRRVAVLEAAERTAR